MPNLDAALSQSQTYDEITIDYVTKQMVIPSSLSVAGVKGDDLGRRLHFRLKKVPDELDLLGTGATIEIHYQNASGQTGRYFVQDATADGDDEVTFSFPMPASFTSSAGKVKIEVCVTKDSKHWHVSPGDMNIGDFFEAETISADDPKYDVIAQLYSLVNGGSDIDTTGFLTVTAGDNRYFKKTDPITLTDAQKNLILTLFQQAVYASDQSANITALKNAFEVEGNPDIPDNPDPDNPDVPDTPSGYPTDFLAEYDMTSANEYEPRGNTGSTPVKLVRTAGTDGFFYAWVNSNITSRDERGIVFSRGMIYSLGEPSAGVQNDYKPTNFTVCGLTYSPVKLHDFKDMIVGGHSGYPMYVSTSGDTKTWQGDGEFSTLKIDGAAEVIAIASGTQFTYYYGPTARKTFTCTASDFDRWAFSMPWSQYNGTPVRYLSIYDRALSNSEAISVLEMLGGLK